MYCLQMHLFILALFLFNDVQSGKVCDLTNIKCLTKAAQNNFKRIVSGIPGLMEPLDTLHENKIVGETPTLKYVLTNTTLYGLKNCEVELLSLNTERVEYEYILQCPHLVLDTDYVVKGTMDAINIDQEGSVEFTADDYLIKFKGTYGRHTDEKDQKLRIFIKTYDIETEPKQKISSTYTIRKGDKALAESFATYFNDNWQSMEKLLRSPGLDILLLQFVKSMTVFLKTYPVDEILSEL